MPVLKVNKDGAWQDIASAYTHAHTVSDITDLPASLVDDVEALKDKVGAQSVAYQVSTAIETNIYRHPETHPASMITGLSDVAISGSYNDLTDLPEEYAHPESHPATMITGLATVATSGSYNDLSNKPTIPSIDGLATKTYVDEQIATVSGSGGSGGITEQVQADWDEADTTSPAYIKNKPVISGDGSASVQANWNQTDETQADFIKNKPFGSGGLESVVFFPQTDIPFTFDGDMHTVQALATPELIELWDSNWISCDVTFDGTTYNCEPQSIQGAKAIGNVDVLMGTGNNGMPFIFAIMNGYLIAASLTDSPDTSEATHNISVMMNREGIKYLDSKFIANVSWDKISEKPFCDIPAGTVVLEETVTMGSYMAETDDGLSILNNLQTLYIIDGAFYKVTIGENEYNAQANGTIIRYEENLEGVFELGMDGLPFFWNNSNYFPNGSAYDVKVVLAEDTVKKIDEKYLSDSLPEVTTTDNNKVLTVVAGVWTAQTPASGLPTVSTSDAGKFLRVSSSGKWAATIVPNAEGASF